MSRQLVHLTLLALAATAAHADPFAAGDPKVGRQMVEKNCIACHASRFGGDGSAIYTREDRKIKDAKGLIQQIRTCNTNLGLKWFEDEELNVASYLNKSYYKFDK
ncbi:MAG TPA: cytochrome c [Methylophilaceae bacterium]|nr:cytochrome c [Methylophilaceae bacterium]HQR60362.1 cytochrome c [Methylophilaceae bacterium]